MSMKTPTRRCWANFTCKAASLVAAIAVFASFSQWAANANAADEAVRAQMQQEQRAVQTGPYAVANGTYRGSAQGYGGTVTVAVTMKNGYIEKVKAVDHAHEDAAWWDLAKELLETIPEKQSTDVDTVSGATYSSAGILNATKKAIASAPKAGS